MPSLLFTFIIVLIACLSPSHSQSMTEGDRIQKYLEKLVQSGYNKQIMPESSDGPGKPINVNCTMYILDVTKVDDINMQYRVRFYFRQSWVDPRLAYPDEDIKSIVLNDAKYVWTPDLFFMQEVEGIQHNLITPNILLRISKNGEVFLSVRMSYTFTCQMDFRKYPHDTQKCTFGIESYTFTRSKLDISWSKEKNPVGMNMNIDHLPFRVTGIQESVRHEVLTTGEYSTLEVELTFQRKAGFFTTRLYLPFIFLVVLSWLSFWIPAKLLAPRLALLLVILYLMVNIGEDINGQAPKSSYTKAVDVWIAVCESLVFASFLEFIAVYILARNKGHYEKGLCKNDTESRSVMESDSKINSVNNEPSNNTVSLIANRLKRDVLLSSRIDKASSILFPVLFIAFNFIYWLVYCTGN